MLSALDGRPSVLPAREEVLCDRSFRKNGAGFQSLWVMERGRPGLLCNTGVLTPQAHSAALNSLFLGGRIYIYQDLPNFPGPTLHASLEAEP